MRTRDAQCCLHLQGAWASGHPPGGRGPRSPDCSMWSCHWPARRWGLGICISHKSSALGCCCWPERHMWRAPGDASSPPCNAYLCQLGGSETWPLFYTPAPQGEGGRVWGPVPQGPWGSQGVGCCSRHRQVSDPHAAAATSGAVVSTRCTQGGPAATHRPRCSCRCCTFPLPAGSGRPASSSSPRRHARPSLDTGWLLELSCGSRRWRNCRCWGEARRGGQH